MKILLGMICLLLLIASAHAQSSIEKTVRLDPALGSDEFVLYESADGSARTLEICAGSDWPAWVRARGVSGVQIVQLDTCRIWTSDRITLERPENANLAKVPVFVTYRYLGK